MPDGYKYEKLSRSEYKKALYALFGYTESDKPMGEKRDTIERALQLYDAYGWSMDLPYAMETTAGRTKTAWQAQYEKEIEQWGLDVDKATSKYWAEQFAYTKWQTSEDWRKAEWERREQKEQWQARTQTQERMWESERARQGMMAEHYGYQAARMGLRAKPYEEAEKAKMFEFARSASLAGLEGDRNRIKRYELQNKPNPWKMQRTVDEEIQETKENIKGLREANKIIQQRMKDPTDKLYMNVDDPTAMTDPEQWRAHEIMSRLKTAEDKLVEWTTSPDYVQGLAEARGEVASPTIEPAGRPATPETPQWMRELHPTMGARLEKQTPVAPSPALWQRWLPSQRQQYLGYAKWAGGNPEDILWQATRPLGQPSRGARWQPARQRVSV